MRVYKNVFDYILLNLIFQKNGTQFQSTKNSLLLPNIYIFIYIYIYTHMVVHESIQDNILMTICDYI